MKCVKLIFKLYLLSFVISTLYALFTLDDLRTKGIKYKDTEDVISNIVLNDDSVYFIGNLANYEFKREKNAGYDTLLFTLSDHIIYVYLDDTTITKSLDGSVSTGGFIHLIINPKKLNKEQKALLDERINLDTSGKFMLEDELLQVAKRQDPTWSDQDEAYLIKYIHLTEGRILPAGEQPMIQTSLETAQILTFSEAYEVEEFNQVAIYHFIQKATAPLWMPFAAITFPIWIQGIPHG